MFNFSLALLHSRPIHGPQSQWGFGYWAPAFFWILKFQLGRPFPPNPTKLCGCLVGLSHTPIWNSLGSLTLTTPSLRLFLSLSLSLSLSPIVIVGASRSSSYVQNYLCNMWQIAPHDCALAPPSQDLSWTNFVIFWGNFLWGKVWQNGFFLLIYSIIFLGNNWLLCKRLSSQLLVLRTWGYIYCPSKVGSRVLIFSQKN
jgi:hypothetical protein